MIGTTLYNLICSLSLISIFHLVRASNHLAHELPASMPNLSKQQYCVLPGPTWYPGGLKILLDQALDLALSELPHILCSFPPAPAFHTWLKQLTNQHRHSFAL